MITFGERISQEDQTRIGKQIRLICVEGIALVLSSQIFCRLLLLVAHLFHLLSKAQGPHVCPNFFDVCEAFIFES